MDCTSEHIAFRASCECKKLLVERLEGTEVANEIEWPVQRQIPRSRGILKIHQCRQRRGHSFWATGHESGVFRENPMALSNVGNKQCRHVGIERIRPGQRPGRRFPDFEPRVVHRILDSWQHPRVLAPAQRKGLQAGGADGTLFLPPSALPLLLP